GAPFRPRTDLGRSARGAAGRVRAPARRLRLRRTAASNRRESILCIRHQGCDFGIGDLMAELSSALERRDDSEARAQALVAIVQELVRELRGQRAGVIDVSLSSRLDRDLGIDSLGRTELVLRLEREFGVRMPTEVIGEADTVRDLLKGLGQANAVRPLAPVVERQKPADAVSGQPGEARTLVEVLEWHVAQHPDRMHATLFADDLSIMGALTYRELRDQARRVAAGLVERDILPGDRIALMLPT